MTFQRTLRDAVSLTGVGLHSGKPVTVTLKPAKVNAGISFVRADLFGSQPIPAHYNYVINTQMATTLGRAGTTVSTVEHVLSALAGADIDNAVVEVTGPEIPILDGSASPFFEAIQTAGVVTQAQVRPYLVLRRKVELKINEKWAVAEPASCLEIHGSVDWEHPAIGFQEFHYVGGRTQFAEISRARTFGFLKDVEALKKMGLIKGGSLENAVVLDDTRVLNEAGLRYPNEFARHKVLDAIGDFKLAGIEIHAFVRLHRAGHDLHSQLLGAIFANPDNFEIIDQRVREESRPSRIRAVMASRLAATV